MSRGFKIFLVFAGVALLGMMGALLMAPTVPGESASSAAAQSFGDGKMVFGFVLLLMGGLVYFVPTLVAGVRGCKAGAGITVINIFLGWTFIGWVVAFAWAACGEVKPAAKPAPLTT